jgi:hypothetical protein
VLFIAWGGSQLDESRAAAFLEDNDNFRKLAARVNTPPLQPVMVFQLGGVGAGGETLQVESRSEELMALWRETAVSTRIAWENSPENDLLPVTQAIPTLSLHWANSTVPPQQDTLEPIDPQKLREVGETLSLTLIKILRKARY